MKIKIRDLKGALLNVESSSQLSTDRVTDILKEALVKAYRKQIGIDEVQVRVEIENGSIELFHQREVLDDEILDNELEISLEDAQKINPNVKVGDFIDEPIDFTTFDRGAVVLAKNFIKQKIREAEKEIVYQEYSDKVGEMVLGTVESAIENKTIVNIGKTLALMEKKDSIRGEVYKEGQKINVVITEVNQKSKGAQVKVSRETPIFVRRLFEREVPEIFQGTIEIKAIARSAGDRTKIAVCSHNVNIDPIGACIGPRGSRVQTIINELNGEKIDIFEWSDNVAELIKNALSPSTALAVLPNLDPKVQNGLVVVVPDNQLSLAIGKQGKNARLAVKLSDRKIDIKSKSEMEEFNNTYGVDYMELAQKMQEEYEEKKAQEKAYKQKQHMDALRNAADEVAEIDEDLFSFKSDEEDVVLEDENKTTDTLYDKEQEELILNEEVEKAEVKEEPVEEVAEVEEKVEEVPVEEPVEEFVEVEEEKVLDEMEEAARIAKEKRKEKAESELKEYTSKFESFAGTGKKEEKAKPKKKFTRNDNDEEEFFNNDDKEPAEKKQYEQMKVIYSDEELAEIEEQALEDEEEWYDEDDVNYEDFDSYYDD